MYCNLVFKFIFYLSVQFKKKKNFVVKSLTTVCKEFTCGLLRKHIKTVKQLGLY